MYKLFLILIFLFLPTLALAQQPTQQAKLANEPKKITLTAEEASKLNQLQMQAQLDAERARASKAELEKYFLQLHLDHEITVKQYQPFDFSLPGWVEKAGGIAGEKGKEK